VLDVWGGDVTDGTPVHIYDGNGGPNQLWAFTVANHDVPFYHVIVSYSNVQLAISADPSAGNATPVLAARDDADPLQLWAVVPSAADGSRFTLKNKHWGTYLTLGSGGALVAASGIDPANSYWNLGSNEANDGDVFASAVRVATNIRLNLSTTGHVGDPITAQGWSDVATQMWELAPVKLAP
jgi:hypothetical protein